MYTTEVLMLVHLNLIIPLCLRAVVVIVLPEQGDICYFFLPIRLQRRRDWLSRHRRYVYRLIPWVSGRICSRRYQSILDFVDTMRMCRC